MAEHLADLLGDAKGTYVLLLEAQHQWRGRIGRLGIFSLPAGYYFYVGSALGPGGLAARLTHHSKPAAKPHWHLDYLRRGLELLEAWVCTDGQRRECAWADALQNEAGFEAAIARFGASDCQCPTHLFYSPTMPSEAILTALQQSPDGKTSIIQRIVFMEDIQS